MRITHRQIVLGIALGALAVAAGSSVVRAEDGQHSRYMIAYSYGVECQDAPTNKLCPD